MAAFHESQTKVVVEFLKSNQGMHRIIRLNHNQGGLPPQLFGRIDLMLWAAFMQEVKQLADVHPYVQSPGAGKVAGWAACFAIGSIIGLFCVDPDGGNYGVWEQQLRALVDRYAGYFMQAGCSLSLHASQRRRDYWLEVDVNPMFAVGKPVMPGPELQVPLPCPGPAVMPQVGKV